MTATTITTGMTGMTITHDAPHESGPLILVPIVILAILGHGRALQCDADRRAVRAHQGLRRAAIGGRRDRGLPRRHRPRRVDRTAQSDGRRAGRASLRRRIRRGRTGRGRASRPSAAEEGEEAHNTGCGFDTPEAGTVCFLPTLTHAEPTLAKILLSLGVVAVGYVVAIAFCMAFYGRRNGRLVGLTERSRIMRGGYLFLENKYYLDALYENVIVRAIAHPIARATYWVNQHVIDGDRQRRRARAPADRRVGLRQHRPADRRRRGQRDPARWPRRPATPATRPVRQGQPVRRAAVRRRRGRRHRPRHRQRELKGFEDHGTTH